MTPAQLDQENKVRAVLQENGAPGETVLCFTIGREMPSLWWHMLIGAFSAFMMKNYYVVFTNEKLWLMEINLSSQITHATPLPPGSFKVLKKKTGLLSSSVTLQYADGKKQKIDMTNAGVVKEQTQAVMKRFEGLG